MSIWSDEVWDRHSTLYRFLCGPATVPARMMILIGLALMGFQYPWAINATWIFIMLSIMLDATIMVTNNRHTTREWTKLQQDMDAHDIAVMGMVNQMHDDAIKAHRYGEAEEWERVRAALTNMQAQVLLARVTRARGKRKR